MKSVKQLISLKGIWMPFILSFFFTCFFAYGKANNIYYQEGPTHYYENIFLLLYLFMVVPLYFLNKINYIYLLGIKTIRRRRYYQHLLIVILVIISTLLIIAIYAIAFFLKAINWELVQIDSIILHTIYYSLIIGLFSNWILNTSNSITSLVLILITPILLKIASFLVKGFTAFEIYSYFPFEVEIQHPWLTFIYFLLFLFLSIRTTKIYYH